MSSGAASASVSAYNAYPPQGGSVTGPSASSFVSPNLAAGSGAGNGVNGQQNSPYAALNPDSVSANPSQNQYRSLMHQEMIAPAPPAAVGSADSAQIFKIGNSGLVAITVAGIVIGVTSFVGIQAVFEALGQRHKHDARRVQQQQDDKNVLLQDGHLRHDRVNAYFEQSATQHKDAVIDKLDAAYKPDKSSAAKASMQSALAPATAAGGTNAEAHKIFAEIAQSLAELDANHPARAHTLQKHAQLFRDKQGEIHDQIAYDTARADLPVDYATEHKAFLEKAVHPIAHAWAVR